jgi:hypothetical protein
MKKLLFILLTTFLGHYILKAQPGRLQIGIQSGFALPQGDFKSGFGPYINNGYASIGVNYKAYAEYRVKGAFCVGINYINFSNSQEEGNLRAGYNNKYTTYKTSVLEKSSTQGILGSLILKGIESSLFLKGFLGLGFSKTGSVSASNYANSYKELQSTSDIGIITGLGIGFYIPIKEKWFIELEADYISSSAKPKDFTFKDNTNNQTVILGDITYNQTVINLNLGVGIFLFND